MAETKCELRCGNTCPSYTFWLEAGSAIKWTQGKSIGSKAREAGLGKPGFQGERSQAHLKTGTLRPREDSDLPETHGRHRTRTRAKLQPAGGPRFGCATPAAISAHSPRNAPAPVPSTTQHSPPAFAAFGACPAAGPASLLPRVRATTTAASPRPRHGRRRRRHLSASPSQLQLYRKSQSRGGATGPDQPGEGRGCQGEKGRG